MVLFCKKWCFLGKAEIMIKMAIENKMVFDFRQSLIYFSPWAWKNIILSSLL